MATIKPKYSMIIAGAALTVIIAVQVYLIAGLYQLRTREFDNTLKKELSQGMQLLQKQYNTAGFDSAYNMIDQVAFNIMGQYRLTPEDSLRQSLDRQTLSYVYYILRRYDMVTPFLKAFFQVEGLDNNFMALILVRTFTLLAPGGDIVITDQKPLAMTGSSGRKQNFFYVNSYTSEGNFYRLRFDYYLDFTRKNRIVFHEMLGALVLALLSVLITGIIFFITLHKLLRYRQLSALKTDFINNMAHELKTPLTTISVAAGTLSDPSIQQEPEKAHRLVTLIKQQNRHLGRLIDHILDINMWERDQIILQKKETVLEELFEKIREAFRLEHNDRDFRLITSFSFVRKEAVLDEFQLAVALHNVLSNALKYGGDPPEIRFSAKTDKHTLHIEISDNGPGIAKEDQARLFEKFYRGRSSSRHAKGLGLGLFYVKKIIEMHGGSVHFKNNPKGGTTFFMEIPIDLQEV